MMQEMAKVRYPTTWTVRDVGVASEGGVKGAYHPADRRIDRQVDATDAGGDRSKVPDHMESEMI